MSDYIVTDYALMLDAFRFGRTIADQIALTDEEVEEVMAELERATTAVMSDH